MEGPEPGRRVDREGEDPVRALLRDLLDVHPALGRGHRHQPSGSPVHQHGDVVLVRDVAAFLDVEPPHGPPRAPGLLRDEHPAQHRARVRPHLVEGAGEPDPALALGVPLEPARAPPAGMDLGLDHPGSAPDRPGRRDRLVHAERGGARGTATRTPSTTPSPGIRGRSCDLSSGRRRPAPGADADAGARPSITGLHHRLDAEPGEPVVREILPEHVPKPRGGGHRRPRRQATPRAD